MIYGHEQVVETILQAQQHDRLAHAYLFSGPAGIGKYSTAMHLARALVCETSKKGGEPCESCTQCRASAHGAHPDIAILTRDPEKKEIGIDAIRALRAKIEQTSFFAGYRIVIIDDTDTMTTEAGNALLRILEEPRGKTIYFLIAANGRHVLPTIRSRSVVIHLEPLAPSRVQSILEKEGIVRSQAATIAKMTRGRIGAALTLARDAEAWQQFNDTTELINTLMRERTWTERRRAAEKQIEVLTNPVALTTIATFLHEKLHTNASRSWIKSLTAFSHFVHTVQTTNVQPLFAFEQFLFSIPS